MKTLAMNIQPEKYHHLARRNNMRKLLMFILIIAGVFTLPFGVFLWILAALLRSPKPVVILKEQI